MRSLSAGDYNVVDDSEDALGPKAKLDDPPFEHPYYWAAFVLVGHAD